MGSIKRAEARNFLNANHDAGFFRNGRLLPIMLLSIVIISFYLLFETELLAGGIKAISPKQLIDLRNRGVSVVDIRTKTEWQQTGVIDKSTLITFFDEKGDYDLNRFLSELGKKVVSKKEPFVLVCRSASRTKTVGHYLRDKLGYQNVYELKGGILNWKQQAMPLVPMR